MNEAPGNCPGASFAFVDTTREATLFDRLLIEDLLVGDGQAVRSNRIIR